ncbi:NAD-dependent epimerase/dehydratase family protein [Patescibacteria group bacterium]|nr:NAD-dependent epimerase/dehydratase family protein [Patescibacteria group bacterium]
MKFPSDVVSTDIAYIHKESAPDFKKLAPSELLLTGAGGFLGYYLTLSLLSWNDLHPGEKIRVTALSRFSHGLPAWLAALEGRKDLTILRRDISCDPLPSGQYDYIVHAASFASPSVYRMYPIETMRANVTGLERLLQSIVKKKRTMKKFLYFSSSEVYGDPTPGNIPTPETYRGNVSCTGPRACYDESKRFSETLSVNYVRQHQVPVVIARPFNNYGPGMKIDDGRVIADFAKSIISGRNIVMYSDGKPSRTYCYIADAICGYIKLLTRGVPGEAYNIGTEKPEVSVAELADTMIAIAGREISYTGHLERKTSRERDYLTDNPQRRCPLIGKARRVLGYNPSISLTEGLRRSIRWYNAVYTS